MRTWSVLIVGLAITGCSNAGSQAEKAYQIASESGNAADRCDTATKVALVYQSAGNSEEYRKWRQKQDDDCLMARMAGSSATGDLTPDQQAKDDATFNRIEAEASGK